ncbi:LEC14B protein [Hirsutella rhossiliensis]|uniref:LEC14B protein n=1 Tax=Hirsutella rhossiliensis TaxID=111463 RepID=A0A9P8MZK3_9HYPO|nr:LEC14B protein [Hirsutella rhossiliensis]KAH0964180.1 LEC14B protein [Hirsutella rhossiliensis]
MDMANDDQIDRLEVGSIRYRSSRTSNRSIEIEIDSINRFDQIDFAPHIPVDVHLRPSPGRCFFQHRLPEPSLSVSTSSISISQLRASGAHSPELWAPSSISCGQDAASYISPTLALYRLRTGLHAVLGMNTGGGNGEPAPSAPHALLAAESTPIPDMTGTENPLDDGQGDGSSPPFMYAMPGTYVDDDDDDDDEMDDDDDEEDDDFLDDDDEDDDGIDDDDIDQDDDPNRHVMGLFRDGERTGLLTRGQLMALLRHRDLSRGLFNSEEDEEGFLSLWGSRRNRQPKDPNRFPKVPSNEGTKLMRSGAFGANDYDMHAKKRICRRMLEREIGLGDREQRKRNNDIVMQSMIPGTRAEQIVHYDDPVYSGQFSDDGNFFFSCSQDFKVRLYDTSNPYEWKHYKTVSYPWGQWTLTDASLSPDNRWLAYTSIQSMVSIAPTDPNDKGDPYTLDLDGDGRSNDGEWRSRRSFGIWSIRFSGDGRELVAGTSSDSIVVYDIESRTVLHHVHGHDDHVNAVCFADKSSPHIVYSGSDDATIKVWDRRSMGDGREAGAFVGHIEGLTYIDSKGDGRYILSNGKDQAMKLWDLRMAKSTARFRDEYSQRRSMGSTFDYRREAYDEEYWDPHPHDNSLVTFRGHKVLRTLIRCHFSPPSSTNSRYVYSGSADGKVYVWNLDATLAGTIDVKKATMGTRRLDSQSRHQFDETGGWGTCVRDASWHPSAPVLVASAWNGYSMVHGTCSLHAFNESPEDEGEPGMRRSVDSNLQPDPSIYQDSVY